MEELITRLLSHLKGMWKYRWYGVAVVWLVAVAGWLKVYTLPDNYESSARIYVDTQNVLQPLMAGMAVAPNIEQQVSIMSRTLISRPNVERVMRMVDLDIKAKTTKEHEQLINDLMSDIKIMSTGQDNLFTISYGNDDPKIAKDVVQSLLTIFVEGGLADKKQDTTSALRFIDDQIKDYQEKLVAAETALKEFKQKNMGLIPGQGTDYRYATIVCRRSTSIRQSWSCEKPNSRVMPSNNKLPVTNPVLRSMMRPSQTQTQLQTRKSMIAYRH